MTNLSRRREVACPYARAVEYFDRYLNVLPSAESGTGRILRLRASLQALGLPSGLAVDHDVIASFDPTNQAPGLANGVAVAWKPVGDGPFPTFRGLLAISAATPKSSTLSLDGEYEPPLGVVGAAFDAAVGHKIAESTADELLNVIGTRIHDDYVHDEPHLSR